MPDADTIQTRQKATLYALVAIPIILLVLYLLPVKVSGHVVDEQTGQPMAGVPVELGNGQLVQTDAQGQFATRTIRLRPVTANVDVEGYQPWEGRSAFSWLPLAAARLDVDVPPNRLHGQVVDTSSGQPVAGVTISASGQSTTSDAGGNFELLYLPSQPLTLRTEAEGFISLDYPLDGRTLLDGSAPVSIELLPNGLHGTITDSATGLPVAGAGAGFGDKASQSEANGFYYLSHVAGTGDLTVTGPGYLPADIAIESDAILSGEQPLDVALEPTVLQGQVLDGRTGQPMAGVPLSIAGQSATTDDSGHYRFERLHGPDLVLEGQRSGYDALQQPVDEVSNLLGGEALDVEMLPRHLAGRVFNLVADSPLAGATVIAGDNTATTDEDGRFILWGAEAPLPVVVSADGFFDAEAQYADDSELRVTLKPRHAVVMVEDLTSGQRLPDVTITGPRSDGATDAQGVALLRLLEPGDVFTATADGFSTVAMTYDGSDQVQVNLYPDTVAGQAVDGKTGEGVPGAVVYVYDGDACQAEACRGTEPVQVVDAAADGSFLVDGLPATPQLMIKAPGYELLYPQALSEAGCDAPYCLQAEMKPFEARGFYIPFHYLYNRDLMRERMDLAAQSPVLNAVVVDIKSDFGELAWDPRYPVAREIGVHQPDVMQAHEVVQMCRERGLYCIARFVTFKDDPLAKGRPEWAVRKRSEPDKIWLDGENLAWVDPYRPEVREYEIELAKELAEIGFDELQFDYFRFTGQDHTKFIYSVESTVENRIEAISSFADELMEALKPYGVFTAIDVFGSIILVGQEPLIGQNLEQMAAKLDYLSPMIYPQVWWPGTFPPYDEPVLHPYEVIYDSVSSVRDIVPLPTRIRPWLQGYPNNYRTSGPATGYNYAAPEMMIQRQAAEDAGAEGWLFWSGGGNFPDEIFGPMPSLAELRAQVAARQGRGG